MSYEKLNLQDGQILEADHLNHIENGIEALEARYELCKAKLSVQTETEG